jgi:hypothetical protein
MNRSAPSFGPWSSALDATSTSHLSRFWKRRLACLEQSAAGEPRFSRRAKVLLAAVAATALALPAVERIASTKAIAQDEPAKPASDPVAEPPAAAPAEWQPAGAFPGNAPARRQPAVEYLPRPSAQELRLQEALKEVTALDFDQQPLAEALAYLAAYHSQGSASKQIQIQIDRSALEESGLTTDVQINARIKNVRLESALRLMLSPHKLTFIVVDDVLKITTEDAAYGTMLVRTYPVGDLIGPENDVDTLIDALTVTIDPNSWSDVGGEGAVSAVPAARSLVVRQSYENHNRLLELIRNLREARSMAGQDAAGGPTTEWMRGVGGGGFQGGGFGGQGGGFFNIADPW